MSGSMNPLAALFVREREPRDEFERERLLNEAYDFIAYAVEGKTVAILTPNGRLFMEAKEHQGCRLVFCDFYPKSGSDRVWFWYNAHSVVDIGELLRKAPEKRVKMDEVMTTY